MVLGSGVPSRGPSFCPLNDTAIWCSHRSKRVHAQFGTKNQTAPRFSTLCFAEQCVKFIWDFPKVRGTLFWGPYNKDPTISGSILGSPIFGNPPYAAVAFCFRNLCGGSRT